MSGPCLPAASASPRSCYPVQDKRLAAQHAEAVGNQTPGGWLTLRVPVTRWDGVSVMASARVRPAGQEGSKRVTALACARMHHLPTALTLHGSCDGDPFGPSDKVGLSTSGPRSTALRLVNDGNLLAASSILGLLLMRGCNPTRLSPRAPGSALGSGLGSG